MSFPNLKKVPITEAVIEFRFTPFDSDQQNYIKEFGMLIKDEYPNLKEQTTNEVKFTFGPEGPAPVFKELNPILICEAEDNSKHVLIADNRISLNWKKEYPGWDLFSEEALNIWMKIQNNISTKEIIRLGVRFINHLDIRTKGIFDMDDYLLNGPKIPKGVPEAFRSFMHHTILVDEKIQCLANYLQSYNPDENEKIVLDIDVYTSSPIKSEREILLNKLSQIGTYKNNIFFGSITPETLNYYLEE